jgi:hypothetical protein
MNGESNNFNKLYRKHTVAIEFLADSGIDIVKNVIKSPELGKNLVGVGSNPNFLRLNRQNSTFDIYPKILRNLG